MHLINCPYCGERAEIEFTYGGDASIVRPDPATASAQEWFDHIYIRHNPRGPHVEWWQHTAGCRQWIKVYRDTWTHEVLGSAPATDVLGEESAS